MQFTRAIETTGCPTSAHWNALAAAVNDRLKSGVGDGAWRAWWLAYSAVRRLDAGTDKPHDWWLSYGLPSDPRDSKPLPDLNTLNPASPPSAWVNGTASVTSDCGALPEIEGERARLVNAGGADTTGLPLRTCATLSEYWQLGKEQRGARESGGAANSPALTAATAHQGLSYDGMLCLPFLQTFGGFTRLTGSLLTLDHQEGHQLDHAAAWFAGDFVGTTATRGDDTPPIRQRAFDAQTFLTRQYPLAPAYTTLDGEALAEPTYPVASFGPEMEDGDFAEFDTAVTAYSTHTGYGFAGYYAEASMATGPTVVECLRDGTVFHTFTLEPGADERVFWFAAVTGGEFKFRLKGAMGADAVTVEMAELWVYLPTVWDAYMLTRCHSAGMLGSGVESAGIDYADAPQLAAGLARYGCIATAAAPPEPGGGTEAQDIQASPLWDEFRRVLRDNLVLITRRWGDVADEAESLVSYTVSSGKSVLRFKQYGSAEADGETVWYDRFGPLVGIVAEAPAKGWSNEWLLHLSTHRHKTGLTGWEVAAADARSFGHERCLVNAAPLNTHSGTGYEEELDNHLAYGSHVGHHVEAPSGYRYVLGPEGNQANANAYLSEDFLQSCQIYVPPYEVESVVLDEAVDPHDNEVVVTLKTRLQHNAAVADFADYGTDENGLLLENGDAPLARSDENAILEYLASVTGDKPACQVLGGDNAYGRPVDGAPYGSCNPRFYFTRLVPKAYEEDPPNSANDAADTPLRARRLQWVHFLLRAMCEGYVDREISVAFGACRMQRPLDFTWPGLVSRAHSLAQWEEVSSWLDDGWRAATGQAGGSLLLDAPIVNVASWSSVQVTNVNAECSIVEDPDNIDWQIEVIDSTHVWLWFFDEAEDDWAKFYADGDCTLTIIFPAQVMWTDTGASVYYVEHTCRDSAGVDYQYARITESVGLTPCDGTAGQSYYSSRVLALSEGAEMRLLSDSLRPDWPSGYGAFANTLWNGEVFNQYARAVNLLTTARVDLPLPLMSRVRMYRQHLNLDVTTDGDAFWVELPADTNLHATEGAPYALYGLVSSSISGGCVTWTGEVRYRRYSVRWRCQNGSLWTDWDDHAVNVVDDGEVSYCPTCPTGYTLGEAEVYQFPPSPSCGPYTEPINPDGWDEGLKIANQAGGVKLCTDGDCYVVDRDVEAETCYFTIDGQRTEVAIDPESEWLLAVPEALREHLTAHFALLGNVIATQTGMEASESGGPSWCACGTEGTQYDCVTIDHAPYSVRQAACQFLESVPVSESQVSGYAPVAISEWLHAPGLSYLCATPAYCSSGGFCLVCLGGPSMTVEVQVSARPVCVVVPIG